MDVLWSWEVISLSLNGSLSCLLLVSSPAEEIEYWKSKAGESERQQQEIQQQFEEFQDDSRELERELEQQLETLETKVKENVLKFERANGEIGDLKEKLAKSKEMSRQDVITLEAKVAALTDAEKKLKARIRELEQTNDDFERMERFGQLRPSPSSAE